MKTMRLAVLACVLGSCTPAVAAGPPGGNAPAVAVLAFEGGSKGEAGGDVIADLLSGYLAREVTVVERKDLRLVLTEHALSLSGAVAPAAAVQVGKLTGAGLIVTGRLFRFGPDAFASVRVVGVATGRLKGVNIRVTGGLDADALAGQVARELLRELPGITKELLAEDDPAGPGPAGPAGAKARGELATVAVLNFESAGGPDPSRDWLRKGLADLVIGDLAGLGLHVVSREQMQEMVRELQVKKANDDPQAVARVLKAGRCVHGTFRADAGDVRLTATVLSVDDGKPLHNAEATGPAGDLIAVQKRLSAELAEVLKGQRAGTIDPAKVPRWTEDLKASQLLYQGIDLFDQGLYLDAWGLFRRALRQDAGYADAAYWAGRMMYYEQEHHQARPELERFVARHPGHPRVGDAVMEVINSAQLTADDAGDVLNVLSAAGQLAPGAEVPNQFGAGNPSTVGLYAAGLSGQILRARGRRREAFSRYADQIVRFPANDPLYWIAWHEMFALKVEHLCATGELLTMPPPPPLVKLPGDEKPMTVPTGDGRFVTVAPGDREKMYRSAGGLHPSGLSTGTSTSFYGGFSFGGDEPRRREFVRLTATSPSAEFDFSADPLISPHAMQSTFTRYFYAGAGEELTGFDVEVRYRHEPAANQVVRIEGDVKGASLPLEPSGLTRVFVPVPPGTRASALRLALWRARGGDTSMTSAVTSWKTTAHIRSAEAPAGTLVLRASEGVPFVVSIDGAELPVVEGLSRVGRVPPGPHTLEAHPKMFGGYGFARSSVTVGAGEEVVISLSAEIPPARHDEPYQPWWTRRVGTPYDPFRLGPDLGTRSGKAGNVRVFEDRRGRWIVVWSLRRDLFMAVSDDRGTTWSPTAKLPPPVNSAHDERLPTLSQDAEGRYLLVFTSDRNLSHAQSVYACWSDDLVNFSAPVRVTPGSAEPLRIVQRSDGTYLAYLHLIGFEPTQPVPHFAGFKECWGLTTSTDLVRWSSPVEIFPATSRHALDLTEQDGRYVVLGGPAMGPRPPARGPSPPRNELEMRESEDGTRFSKPTTVPFTFRFHYGDRIMDQGISVSQVVLGHAGGRTLAMVHALGAQGVVLRSAGGNNWEQIATIAGQFRDVGTQGDFLLGEDALWYFSQPDPSTKRDATALSRWSPEGDPVLMSLYRYRWGDFKKPAPDEPWPADAVNARVVRRVPPPSPKEGVP